MDTSVFNTPSILRDKEAVAAAIEGATSKRQVLDRLGLRPAGGNNSQLTYYAELHGLELPDGSRISRIGAPLLTLEEYQARRRALTPRAKRLFLEKLTPVCSGCGIGPEYNGKPLTLQLDHIDGDSLNNLLENLRVLCPNCHSQTDTWGKGKAPGKRHLCRCGKPITLKSKRCRECYREDQKLVPSNRPICRCGKRIGWKSQTCMDCRYI